MAAGVDAESGVTSYQQVAPKVNFYTITLRLGSTDETTLEGTHGIVTLPAPINLAGIAGGSGVYVTLSKDIPENPTS